jgi:hypothetical protein
MTLDFMGLFAYGASFGFLARGEDTSGFHDFIIRSITSFELMGTIPWIRPIMLALPNAGMKPFQQFSRETIRNRIKKGSSHHDVFYYLVRSEPSWHQASYSLFCVS